MKLAMIYMASGFGRRFGANKLLLPFKGQPLYLYGLKCLLRAKELLQAENIESRVIVVSQYPEILKKAESLGAEAVLNRESRQGITASIGLGTIAAGEETENLLYFVADQPFLKAETVRDFVLGFLESLKSGKTMGSVEWKGTPGSPNIFSGAYVQQLLALSGDKGGRQLMRKYPEQVWTMEVPQGELVDIDRPEDIKDIEGPRL